MTDGLHSRTGLAGAMILIFVAVPAHAGFYLEGLKPFAETYCNDQARPPGSPPPFIDMSKASPDAVVMEGRQPYIAHGCSDMQSANPKASRPARRSLEAVPQK